MKKLFFVVLFFSLSFCIFAQEKREKPLSIGIGPEWNMDSRHNFAVGAVLGITYNLPNNFAMGLDISGSSNFSHIHVLEPDLFLRYYLFTNNYSGLYIQIDAGAFLMFEDDEFLPMIQFGFRGGYRWHLGSSFFVEPYGRLGYPYAFGIGLVGGLRF